jgi:hypothetical protein
LTKSVCMVRVYGHASATAVLVCTSSSVSFPPTSGLGSPEPQYSPLSTPSSLDLANPLQRGAADEPGHSVGEALMSEARHIG